MPQTHTISPPCDAQALAAESEILPVPTGMTLLRPAEHRIQLGIPFYADLCPAGFPSPAADYVESELDLNELCIRRPAGGAGDILRLYRVRNVACRQQGL